MQACVGEAGFWVVTNQDSGTSTFGDGFCMIQKNIMIGSYRTSSFMKFDADGNNIEANVFIMPRSDTRAHDPNVAAEFTAQSVNDNTYNSNTLINLVDFDPFDAGGGQMSQTSGTVTANNNLFYQPNTPSGVDTSDGPIQQTSNHVTPVEVGRLDSDGDTRATTATLIGAGEFDIPYPASNAGAHEDATTGLISYRDMTGRVRGASPSRGALEPA